jgi:putative oxidoreductase
MHGPDIASLLLRAIVGFVLFAHGYNHVWGGGKLPGTARWFESIGIRPGRVHAALASVTELAGGVLLFLGFLTPLGGACAVGTMTVALVANHLRNGFFIFRKGEGYEYVLMIIVVGAALGALGGGRASVDHALGLADDLQGGLGLALSFGAGAAGAALLLLTCWRPKQDAAA